MTGTRTMAVVLASVAIATAGCAAMRREQAEGTEQLLAAAGFQIRPANTAARQADLKDVTPDRLQAQPRGDTLAYTFYDPDGCQCVYIGGPNEYEEYQRLKVQRQIADERAMAAEEEEEATLDWGMWGPMWW